MQRNHFAGSVDFLLPDGTHTLAKCDARYTRERWQGTVELPGLTRSVERGDVCRVTATSLGELRVIILDRTGSHRYDFVALVHPDPFESL